MAKQNKNLNLTNLKKEVKKLTSQTEHVIKINENDYKVKIDDKFLKTKQHALLDDLVEFFNEGNNRIELLDVATPYTTLLFIKHFTSIDVSDNVDEALEVLDVLINLDLLGHILNLMPEQEVVKVYELITVTVDRMKENIDETAEEASRLSELVENKELKEALINGKEK
jgi:F0F1-type ATP synthase alpha subunit